jgi:predicted transcriptional regulator
MAMTLRLTADEDRTLAELARAFRTSKNGAAARAIDLAAPRPSHPDFVAASTRRLLHRYAGVMSRLAEA